MNQASFLLQNSLVNIHLALLSSIPSDPTLHYFKRRKYACPLLFRKRFLFLVGLSDSSFGIRIVVTGPVISRLLRGGYWMGKLSKLLILLQWSTRHHRLSEAQIIMCQAQIKIMDYFPSKAVQSSVRADPKIRAGGRQPNEKCTLELVLNGQFSETLGSSHADSGSSGSCAGKVL